METKKILSPSINSWDFFPKLQLLEVGEERLKHWKDKDNKEVSGNCYVNIEIPKFEQLLKIRRKISATKIVNWWKKYHKSKESDEGYGSDGKEQNKLLSQKSQNTKLIMKINID